MILQIYLIKTTNYLFCLGFPSLPLDLSPLGSQLLVLSALLVVAVDHLLVQLPLFLGQHALGSVELFLVLLGLLGQRHQYFGLGFRLGALPLASPDRLPRQLGLELALPLQNQKKHNNHTNLISG